MELTEKKKTDKKPTNKKDKLSFSALSRFDKSPNHLLEYWNGTHVTTSAMQEGSLGHLLILQKDKFESKYKIYDGRRAGKIWIEFKDEALAENPKVEIITRSTYESVSRLVDISLKDKQFSELLSQIGETEKYIEWTRKNQKFHGYVDGVADDFIFDIKFCQDSGDKFLRDLKYGDINMQGAMYLDYYNYDRDFLIVAIEKKPPFNVQTYRLGKNMIETGRQRYLDLIDEYKLWDGKPKGYSDTIIEVI